MDAVALLAGYAAHLGIPVHDPPADEYPMWDGTALKRPVDAEDWAHEIAHWLIADPDRRRFVNYGWGHDAQFVGYEPGDPDPYGFGPRPDLDRLRWAPVDAAPDGQEEILACLLGFSMLVRVGCVPPWDPYGFVEYQYHQSPAGIDPSGVVKVLAPSVYADRREVQPWVAGFATWLCGVIESEG